MMTEEREKRIKEITPLLEAAQKAQEEFWDALRALEEEAGVDLPIDNYELQNLSVEDVLEMAEEEDDRDSND